MSRLARALVVALAVLAAVAATASAHQGDPRYRSVVDGIHPASTGLTVQVLGYDNELELVNRTGRTVVVYGYDKEPYARIAADGTVAVNRNSPAYYLNEDRFADVNPPARVSAHPHATPSWQVQDRTGRFVFHDHRMHWMAHTIPPQVHDQHKKTKVFDYAIPLAVGSQQAAIDGTLFWIGQPSGFPVDALVALVAIALLAIGTVVVVRRRRRRAAAAGAPGPGEAQETAPAGDPPTREVW